MFQNINGKTKLLGLLGWPVSHTKSPRIHNSLADHYDQNVVYVPLPVHPNNVASALQGLPALGFLGVNVTVPHKQAVIPFLDEVNIEAQAIGAVNTILFEQQAEGGSRAVGYNTDGLGFANDLKRNDIEFQGRHCIVLGAGGSARAVVYTLLKADAKVFLCARRPEQANQLKSEMAEFVSTESLYASDLNLFQTIDSIGENPLIVNTTPVGMSPNIEASVWPNNLSFPAGSVVYDLIYNPAETRLMQQARAAGCKAVNGLGMLLEQAAEAFGIWTGVFPDSENLGRIDLLD